MHSDCKGMLLVLSGPSGTGKSTLYRRLMQEDPSLLFSVSWTTRSCRPGETEGVDYHYVSQEQYDALVAERGFLEHATVHGHSYGTPRGPVEEAIAQGRTMLLDIDPQGALQVMDAMPECVSVFILPPSMRELRRRLESRGTESAEEIARRFRNAEGEIALRGRYGYQLVNEDVDTAVRALHCIVEAERLRTCRYAPRIEDE